MMHARSTSAAQRPALTVHSGPDAVYVREIAVVGPGVVGLPMAALLATAELWAPDGAPTRVTVVQRASATSGWKVGAINAGRSPIGALEPTLDELVYVCSGCRSTARYSEASDRASVRRHSGIRRAEPSGWYGDATTTSMPARSRGIMRASSCGS